MQRTFLGVAWAMALVTSIVLLALSAGAVVLAATTPVQSAVSLDAWRGALVCIVLLVVSSSLLAALTVARLRRGEALVDAEIVEPRAIVVESHTTADADRGA